MTLRSKWTSAGIEHEVVTTKDPGETEAEFIARHVRTVNALKEIYPPDVPPGP
jgi:hypothetical protein